VGRGASGGWRRSGCVVQQQMSTDTPQRGAAAVDDELEVGFDRDFEARWARAQIISHVVMIVIVIAALIGLLGRGPLSHRTLWTPDGRLGVNFEPLARFGTSTRVTLHLSAPGGNPAQARVILSSSIVEPMGLQQIIPAPVGAEAAGRELAYTFDIAPGKDSGLVRFVFKPATVGPVQLYVKAGVDSISFTQWVLP
jgi:hypothetical protein